MKACSLLLLLALSGCAARAQSPTVQEYQSPTPGIRCYGFHDQDGKLVGGSCVKAD